MRLNIVYVPTNHVYVGDIFLLEEKDVIHTSLSVREGLGGWHSVGSQGSSAGGCRARVFVSVCTRSRGGGGLHARVCMCKMRVCVGCQPPCPRCPSPALCPWSGFVHLTTTTAEESLCAAAPAAAEVVVSVGMAMPASISAIQRRLHP